MYTNKEIWNVSYPIFLGLLAQNIYQCDRYCFPRQGRRSRVGSFRHGWIVLYLCLHYCFRFSVGSQILIARRNGEGRYKDVGPVMIQGGTFLLGLAVLMFGLTHLLAPSIVRLLISSDSILMLPWNFSTGVFGAFLRLCQRDVPCAVYWYYTY